MKKIILILIAGLFSMAAGLMARSGLPEHDNAKHQPLPEFSLPDLSGQQRTVSEWQGKILIINFWATWCPPCKKEIPEFIKLQKQFAERGVQFIGIAIDDKEPVDEFLSFTNINFPVLIAPEEGVALAHKMGNLIDAVPFTVVVDAQGQIIHRHQGEFSNEQILEIIKPILSLE